MLGNDSRTPYQIEILKAELCQIEKKSLRNWKYFYYVAQNEFCHSNFKAALKAINKSIKLHPEYPELYMFRYRVRAKLEKAIKPYQEDPDMVLMEEKKQKWVFPLFEN